MIYHCVVIIEEGGGGVRKVRGLRLSNYACQSSDAALVYI